MNRSDYWNKSWSAAEVDALFQHLKANLNQYRASEEIAFFQKEKIRAVCDAGCGFGAYTLALAAQGFDVKGFDISEKAAECAAKILQKFGYDIEIKTADILCTGYLSDEFDGAFAHSVLDHMVCADVKKALKELCRIVRAGGLILLSFDTAEEADYSAAHDVLPDGSLLYTGTSRKSGMVFHPYTRAEIRALVAGKEIVFESVNHKGEQIVIIKNG